MNQYLPTETTDYIAFYVGSPIVLYVIVAVAAYFLGCFNGAVIVSKYILHNDIRNHGSGNAGLTNFHRVFGGKLTAVVILCDVLKAVFAVLLGAWLFSFVDAAVFGKYWAAVFCLLGHMYPCMFGFRGGKGVLSGGTVVVMMDWRIALVAIGLFLICVVATRYVSLGSCCAAASFPFTTWFVFGQPVIFAMAAFLGGLVVWKHRANIKRLLAGNESKFSLHKKKEDSK